jgi:septum formation protein
LFSSPHEVTLRGRLLVVTDLVLASTSPARLTLLRNAGISPLTIAPGVDEDALVEKLKKQGMINGTADMVSALARAKARAVINDDRTAGKIILGCDSSLEFEGESLGKPHQPEVAIERWKRLRGKSGILYSGHHLVDRRNAELADLPSSSITTATKVHFAEVSNAEIERYVATGEPLKVAGAFTIDGLGGAFLERIEGDTHTVIGLSLIGLRQMCQELGIEYTSLWRLAQ